jgi:flagellar basal-body rod protein FlgG
MNPSLYSLSATMINQLNRVDTLSNNLANVNTTGFKEDNLVEGSFNHYLERAKEKKFETTTYSTIVNTVPKIDGSYVTKQTGPIVQTGNQLDFALNSPDTFFKIKDNNGNILLTRDGSFKNLNGFLVTGNGESVLNNNNQAIAVEEGFEQNISIVRTDYNNIYKVGNNNYKFDNNQLVTPVVNLENQIVQGALEKSNINSVSTMVELIDAQRRLEQAQRAITGLSQMSEKLLQKIDGR